MEPEYDEPLVLVPWRLPTARHPASLKRSGRQSSGWTPIPPFEMPPARTLRVPGHGELFLRDTGGDGPVVMLLHGWMASADLNWCGAYGDLIDAGYRVIAIDHRGHGRGLRPLAPFRLEDCAGDAAAALRQLDLAPALIVGYSMGGAIAQLIARDHPDVASGIVLSGTAQHWQDPQTRRTWRAMGSSACSCLSIRPGQPLSPGVPEAQGDSEAWFLDRRVPRRPVWWKAEGFREIARNP